MCRVLLSLIAAVAAGPALADEAMSTAGATGAAPPPSVDTAAQIDRWIADSPAAQPAPASEPRLAEDARRVHGEVGVSVGTGGYRSGYVVTHIPIGGSGSATIALSKTDFGDRVRPVIVGHPGRLGVPPN